jgi:hypothetical protein
MRFKGGGKRRGSWSSIPKVHEMEESENSERDK